jgi:hypothetical protein
MLARAGLKILDEVLEKAPTPGVKKKRLLQQAKKLRAVEAAGIWSNPSLVAEVRRQRIRIEKEACKIVVQHGSPRTKPWKRRAVNRAHKLLVDFGKSPSLSADGPWHKLATILLGNLDTDLFEYLRDYRFPGRRRRPRCRA